MNNMPHTACATAICDASVSEPASVAWFIHIPLPTVRTSATALVYDMPIDSGVGNVDFLICAIVDI